MMRVLSQRVGTGDRKRGWLQVIFKRENSKEFWFSAG